MPTKTVFSTSIETDRQARQLLERLCSDGPEMVTSNNRVAAELLVKYDHAELISGGSKVQANANGKAAHAGRIVR